MPAESKHFLLNRAADWQGFGEFTDGHFENDCFICQQGIYCSHALDTGEGQMTWNRLRLTATLPRNALVTLYILTSDTRVIAEQESLQARFDRIKQTQEPIYNPVDLPLYAYQGRWLWFALEIQSPQPVIFQAMQIEFPRAAFASYLPEIYRREGRNSFIARFMMIFQSIYLDIEQQIDRTPALLDPVCAPLPFLQWLGEWFSLTDIEQWETNRLREFIRQIAAIYRIKGTEKSIYKVVEAYAEVKPILIEQRTAVTDKTQPEAVQQLQQLYGSTPYSLTVLLPAGFTAENGSYTRIKRLIDQVKPAELRLNLVMLQNTFALGTHCYLGINSYLAENTALRLGQTRQTAIYLEESTSQEEQAR